MSLVFRIVPPEPATPLAPVTVRLPLVPVLDRWMPLDGPALGAPAEIDSKVSPEAPIVVPQTLSAMPS